MQRHNDDPSDDLEQMAFFDADYPMDPYPFFDAFREAFFGKTELEIYAANRDIDEWLNSIMTVDEQLVKLLEEQPPAPKAPLPPMVARLDTGKFRVPRLYNCPFCQRRFYSEATRKRHAEAHARRQLRCSQCQFTVRSIDALERHTNYYHRYVKFRAHLPSF